MDNQQETISDNYLSGLIDSDFGVYITKSNYKGKIQYTPIIKFVNTRFILTDVCIDKLISNGIRHYVSKYKATVGKESKYLIIQRLTQCILFAKKYKHLAVGRHTQLELLSTFCKSRLDGYDKTRKGNKFSSYTEKEVAIYEELRLLNYNNNFDSNNRNYSYYWLAGMIDGDGSIFLTKTKRKCKYKTKSGDIKVYDYVKYLPTTKITTESTAVLNNVIHMYEELGVNYFVEQVESKVSRQVGRQVKKVMYNITVNSFSSLKSVFCKLDNKLVGKQKQLDIVSKFIATKEKDKHNTEFIDSLYKKCTYLNNCYQDSSETNTQDIEI